MAMEALRGAPRTLSLQHFAAARATELLSLHSSLKARKRKGGVPRDDAHDDGEPDRNGSDQTDGAALCGADTSFPRHLRRRTSCYARRRLPLPWLYKRKRRPFPPSAVQSKKRRRKRRKKAPDDPLNQNAHQDGALDAGLVSNTDATGSSLLMNMSNAHGVSAPQNAAATTALPLMDSFLTGGVSIVSSEEIDPTSMLQSISQKVLEDAATHCSRIDNGSILLSIEESVTPVASQAEQPEVVRSYGDPPSPMNVDGAASLAQGESHEGKQDFLLNGETGVSLSAENNSTPICHIVQEDSIDYISVKEAHITTCIENPVLHNQGSPSGLQGIKDTKRKKMCRPLRRLLEFKAGGSLIAQDGTRRLETHKWHAKRFTISKLWGYRIAIGRHGRGCGSRAILKWSKSKALLHDSSFISAIQLVGEEENIIKILKPVLQLPEKSLFVEAGEGSSMGRCFTPGILHHVSQAFHGVISPVIVMWKPVMPEVSASNCTEKGVERSQDRNLWLWVHAGAFGEAYQMLEDICLSLNDGSKDDKVTCISRRGDLGQLDLVGEGSLAVLQKVLFPVCRDHQGKAVQVKRLDELLNPELKGNCVLYLEVTDPRLKEKEHYLALEPVCTSTVVVFDDRRSKLNNLIDDRDKSVGLEIKHEHETCHTSCDERYFCHPSKTCLDALWMENINNSKQMFEQPVREKFLSRMRHADRLDDFGLTPARKSNQMLDRKKKFSQRLICPIIVLKHEHERLSCSGWSLIVPMSWIVAFWVPLVFAGGHVIGVRERHWLCTDAGRPAFPDDFPDCKAYAEMKTDKDVEFVQQNHEKLDNRKIPMPDEVLEDAQKDVVQGQLVEEGVLQELLVQSALVFCAADPGKTADFAGLEHCRFVARTAQQLVSFLHMTHQTGLLLFPSHKQQSVKFQGLSNCLQKGTIAWRPKSPKLQVPTITAASQSVCLLRMCLRPFARGVAKVGAKVYAPTPNDYLMWSCKEKTSEGVIPGVDGRAPSLGFVTSMAPHGSRVSSAIAFCDAIALGLTRQHQWINTTWHKKREIFLMFCNEGSTIFRPSFGSICIEEGPDL